MTATHPTKCHPNHHTMLMGSVKLARRPHAFINQLLHFDEPRLVIRTQGLSICRETEFGIFFRDHDPKHPVFTDPVSGLTIDSRQVSEIFLYQSRTGPPSFEMRFFEDGFAITIQPGTSNHSQIAVARIVNSFFVERANSGALREQGAGAWLDEWPHVLDRGSRLKRSAHRFSATLLGQGFSINVDADIGCQDRDEAVHRIISSDGHTSIFAHESIIQHL